MEEDATDVTEARRLTKVEMDLAVLADRQNRYDNAQLVILGKLDSIQRDLGTWREMQAEAFITRREGNDAVARGNKSREEIWTEIREVNRRSQEADARVEQRIEAGMNSIGAKIDARDRFLMGALGSSVIALSMEIVRLIVGGHPAL